MMHRMATRFTGHPERPPLPASDTVALVSAEPAATARAPTAVARRDPLLQLHDLEAALLQLHVPDGIDWLLSFA
jgi:hypothetical protein